MEDSTYLVLEIVTYWLPDLSDLYRILVDVSRDVRGLVQTRLLHGRSEYYGRNLLVSNGALRFPLEMASVFDRMRAVQSLSMQTVRNVFGDKPLTSENEMYLRFYISGVKPANPSVTQMAVLGWWQPILDAPGDAHWYMEFPHSLKRKWWYDSGRRVTETIMRYAPDDILVAILRHTGFSREKYWDTEWLEGKPLAQGYVDSLP